MMLKIYSAGAPALFVEITEIAFLSGIQNSKSVHFFLSPWFLLCQFIESTQSFRLFHLATFAFDWKFL